MVLDRHQTDLYVRPSWLDAAVALRQIDKVRTKSYATTVRTALRPYLRSFVSQVRRRRQHFICGGNSAFVAFLLSPCGVVSVINHTPLR